MNPNKEGLIEYLKIHGKDKSWKELADLFQFAGESGARSVNKRLTKKDYKTVIESQKSLLEEIDEFESKINNEKGTSSVKWISTKQTLTEDEIYKECHMDPNRWILVQIWHKKKSAGFVYSADFKLKVSTHIDNIQNEIEHLLDTYKSHYKPLSKNQIILNEKYIEPCVALLSLTDAHLDMMDLKNSTIDQRISRYKEVLEELLYQGYHSHFIDEIVYVIGNDIFNTDNYLNSTTQLTQQYNNCQWDISYEKIFDLQVECINKLKQFCNKLTIISVGGNHDRTKTFYLAHALEIYFKSDKEIVFNRSSDHTKCYTYGVTGLFFHHGDQNPKELPLYMASKYNKEWGATNYHEVAIGDKHHKKSWNLKLNLEDDEIQGTRIFMTPALCGANQWSSGSLLDQAIQAGTIRFYNQVKGFCGELESRI